MKFHSSTLTRGLLATAVGLAAIGVSVAPASAYVACNRYGDCWHTDTRVSLPGITLSFHDDNWWDHHRHDHHYTWHENDRDHDWHHGYWDHGVWHNS